MKVLVIGGGGREHALVWKISKSPRVKKIFCAPGNAGIAKIAECVDIGASKIDLLLKFAMDNEIDLTVVGPEDPLSMGIVDKFEKKGLRVFGASGKAAELEASKSFMKNVLNKYGIPTAEGESFTDFTKAKAYIKKTGAPIVVKADGLAAGKGVLLCETEKEAIDALKQVMQDRAFGDAGDRVLIEEMLIGEEASFLAFTDGKTVVPLPTSQDHKAVYDGDKGPNTGGMGAYSPAPVVDRFMHKKIMDQVMIPTVNAMAAEGRPYKGVLYAGLMINRGQPRVLEFNARFGDPEAQPLLMRLKSDIIDVMDAVIDEKLDTFKLKIDERPTVCVVMASGGYPGAYKKGSIIKGLDDAAKMKDVFVFHAGTTEKNGKITATGGRVLGVTALGNTIEQAIKKAYKAVDKISWPKVYFRTDIGAKAAARMDAPKTVGIVMGSDSDLSVMEAAAGALSGFGISWEMTVASAHRTPARAAEYASTAQERGLKVIIAGAGHAAHLAGVLAAHTTLPVIGVPIDSSALLGMDALLATVQMPPGIPVATMAVGKSGAKNAGIFAAQIIAQSEPDLADALDNFKKDMADQVAKKAARVENM